MQTGHPYRRFHNKSSINFDICKNEDLLFVPSATEYPSILTNNRGFYDSSGTYYKNTHELKSQMRVDVNSIHGHTACKRLLSCHCLRNANKSGWNVIVKRKRRRDFLPLIRVL